MVPRNASAVTHMSQNGAGFMGLSVLNPRKWVIGMAIALLEETSQASVSHSAMVPARPAGIMDWGGASTGAPPASFLSQISQDSNEPR